MIIDLDRLYTCEECGIVFDYKLEKFTHKDYCGHVDYRGNCPCCNHEFDLYWLD